MRYLFAFSFKKENKELFICVLCESGEVYLIVINGRHMYALLSDSVKLLLTVLYYNRHPDLTKSFFSGRVDKLVP